MMPKLKLGLKKSETCKSKTGNNTILLKSVHSPQNEGGNCGCEYSGFTVAWAHYMHLTIQGLRVSSDKVSTHAVISLVEKCGGGDYQQER
jgi:hypothetical protein